MDYKENMFLHFFIFLSMFFSQFLYSSLEYIFSDVYAKNSWNGKESISGPGSSLERTVVLRNNIFLMIKNLNIKSLLDAPCGDFNWMKEINLSNIKYLGVDIVQDLIDLNNKKYSSNNISFLKLNLTLNDLPKVDLILCRDCLVHLSFEQIYQVLRKFKDSGSKYLLTTTFLNNKCNNNTIAPKWRLLNLCLPPFNFPLPLKIINEQYIGNFNDKSLGLWLIKDLPIN